MRTILVYLLAIAALVVGAWFALPGLFGTQGDAKSITRDDTESPPPVIAIEVRRRPFSDTLEALGTVIANESVALTPNRADQVVALHFDDGTQVEKGQLLLELNTVEERAQLAEAIAVRNERRDNLKRARELFDGKLLSEGELDTALAAFGAAEARVASLQASIDDSEIRAPFAGVLGLRQVSVGAYIQPSTLLTTLDDLSVVKLDFTIPETWLREVKAGMTIVARGSAWPGDDFVGQISQLDTRLDTSTRSLTVRAVLPNPEMRLRPGMLLQVEVQRGEGPVLQVPEEAVIPVGSDEFVFVVDEDAIAHEISVQTGRRRVGSIEILDGLEEGQLVVIEGIVRVRDGSPVQVVATREP